MTRTLALLRHAKSAYPTGVPDVRRPLADRGSRDAEAAGRLLRERVGDPDLVLVSTATRAQATWEQVRAAYAHPPRHMNESRIYDASVDDLLLLLREVDDAVTRLVLVGHNPGLEELAFALSGDASEAPALAGMSEKFPTCGLAVLTLDRSWAHVVPGVAALRSFDVARG